MRLWQKIGAYLSCREAVVVVLLAARKMSELYVIHAVQLVDSFCL